MNNLLGNISDLRVIVSSFLPFENSDGKLIHEFIDPLNQGQYYVSQERYEALKSFRQLRSGQGYKIVGRAKHI